VQIQPPVNVAAMVNNRAITYEELDKNFQSRFSLPPSGRAKIRS
jgi:hypothetical protein